MTPVTSAATRITSASPTYVYFDSASIRGFYGRMRSGRDCRAHREIGLDPGIVDLQDLLHGPVGKDRAARQHDDPIDHGEQRVEVVRHEEHGDAEVVDQRTHERIEAARGR